MAIEIPTSGEPKINGEDVINASQSFDNESKPSVALSFNSNVADVWSKWTEQKVGKVIAIVLDDQVFSSPFIRQKFQVAIQKFLVVLKLLKKHKI